MAFQRKQFDIVLERIKEPRGKIQVVIGPRMAEAKRLMTENPEMKLKDIAQQSGFSSPTVFSRVFIRETGMTPGDWK